MKAVADAVRATSRPNRVRRPDGTQTAVSRKYRAAIDRERGAGCRTADARTTARTEAP